MAAKRTVTFSTVPEVRTVEDLFAIATAMEREAANRYADLAVRMERLETAPSPLCSGGSKRRNSGARRRPWRWWASRRGIRSLPAVRLRMGNARDPDRARNSRKPARDFLATRGGFSSWRRKTRSAPSPSTPTSRPRHRMPRSELCRGDGSRGTGSRRPAAAGAPAGVAPGASPQATVSGPPTFRLISGRSSAVSTTPAGHGGPLAEPGEGGRNGRRCGNRRAVPWVGP